MFTKLMTIPDGLIGRYYTLLTDVLPGAIAAIEEEIASGKLHPMQAKRDLARMITADFSSHEAAVRAEENWSKQFQQGGVSEDLDEVAMELAAIAGAEPGTIRVAKLLVALGLAASNGEANRKLAEGAVKIEGVVVKEQTVPAAATLTVRLGKKAKRALITL